MRSLRRAAVLAALLPAAAAAQLRPAAGPSVAEIRAPDLERRLYDFAADSMQGREAGTEGHLRATRYLVRELERLGLRPAGENGTFLQAVPLVRRSVREATPFQVAGQRLRLWTDFAPYLVEGTRPRAVEGAEVVYGGRADEPFALAAADVAGKVVLFTAPAGVQPIPIPPMGPGSPLAQAAAVAITGIDGMYEELTQYLRGASFSLAGEEPAERPTIPLILFVPGSTAASLLGARPEEARPGQRGARLSGSVADAEERITSPNVVAVLPGSDPALRGQYVAVGAHSDHDGIRTAGAQDHDSLRAFEREVRRRGGESLSAAERAAIRVSARSRPDSIFNGADDDGSGSMALLEIAERFARERPRRSLLFVWHTAEEKGLLGAAHFTDHPTVPRDSIVAALNIDMIGRGGADDLEGGGPTYLQLIGSRRLSTELGELVETANRSQPAPFRLDYTYDAAGHPEQYYCRSDHYMYARYGIPVVFFSTGNHIDYHQVTDEPQYIDYAHYTAVTRLIADVARRVAALDHRLVVDQPKPDPHGECRQ